MVIRVLDILSPINCVIPDYDFNIQLPEAGQLIGKRKLSGRYGNYHPLSIHVSACVSSGPKCLGLLFPESTLSSPQKCEYPLDDYLFEADNLFSGGQLDDRGLIIRMAPFTPGAS